MSLTSNKPRPVIFVAKKVPSIATKMRRPENTRLRNIKNCDQADLVLR
jgi:hypothetical protein